MIINYRWLHKQPRFFADHVERSGVYLSAKNFFSINKPKKHQQLEINGALIQANIALNYLILNPRQKQNKSAGQLENCFRCSLLNLYNRNAEQVFHYGLSHQCGFFRMIAQFHQLINSTFYVCTSTRN